MTERWLSIDEISVHLGVKKDTIYKWVQTTNIPYHEVGRLLKFKVKDVGRWVQLGKAAPKR
jgi:excisionase family DNA binding protein